jgi:hypothetical protein
VSEANHGTEKRRDRVQVARAEWAAGSVVRFSSPVLQAIFLY